MEVNDEMMDSHSIRVNTLRLQTGSGPSSQQNSVQLTKEQAGNHDTTVKALPRLLQTTGGHEAALHRTVINPSLALSQRNLELPRVQAPLSQRGSK